MPSTKRKAELDASADAAQVGHDISASTDVAAPFPFALGEPPVADPTAGAPSEVPAPEASAAAASPQAAKLARKRGRKKKSSAFADIEGAFPSPDEGVLIGKGDKKDFKGGQAQWCAMLYELLLYKSNHGHTNVRTDGDEPSTRALYAWCVAQRKHYKLFREGNGNFSFLTPDRVAVLDAAGMEWNVRGDAFWKKQFAALKAYYTVNGHTMVPRNWDKDPKLGEWVTDQRRQYRFRQEGKPSLLSDDRMQKLQALNFTWRIRDRIDWSDRYNELLEFRTENGHCIVPQHYFSNKPLGKWVAKQREQHRYKAEGKHSFLTEERIQLLNDIGFAWSIKGRSHKGRQSIDHIVVPPVGAKNKAEQKHPGPGYEVDVKMDADPVAAALAVAAAAADTAVDVADHTADEDKDPPSDSPVTGVEFEAL